MQGYSTASLWNKIKHHNKKNPALLCVEQTLAFTILAIFLEVIRLLLNKLLHKQHTPIKQERKKSLEEELWLQRHSITQMSSVSEDRHKNKKWSSTGGLLTTLQTGPQLNEVCHSSVVPLTWIPSFFSASSTDWLSLLRINPLSICTAITWSRFKARFRRAVQTVESTPPLSKTWGWEKKEKTDLQSCRGRKY